MRLMGLLKIKNLEVEFPAGDHNVRVIDGVSLQLEAGQTLSLVGESGCGKSVTALSIARLIPNARYAGGEILLNGGDVLAMSGRDLQRVRGAVVSYVFQEPGVSLNPVMAIGGQIREALKLHRPEHSSDAEIIRLLKIVGIPAPETRMAEFPFRLSGGMQQRVMLAMALAAEPQLLVADEATTALDVTIQAEIVRLLRDLQARLGMAILFITHNPGLAGELGGNIAVMYGGQVVETGPAADLLRRPWHPYTQALLDSVPKLGGGAARLQPIPGQVPAAGEMPQGCRFAPRCAISRPDCSAISPALLEVNATRQVRCPYARTE